MLNQEYYLSVKKFNDENHCFKSVIIMASETVVFDSKGKREEGIPRGFPTEQEAVEYIRELEGV